MDNDAQESHPGLMLKGIPFWWRLFWPRSISRKSPLPVRFEWDPEAVLQPGYGEIGPSAVLDLGPKPKREERSIHTLGPGSASPAQGTRCGCGRKEWEGALPGPWDTAFCCSFNWQGRVSAPALLLSTPLSASVSPIPICVSLLSFPFWIIPCLPPSCPPFLPSLPVPFYWCLFLLQSLCL